MIFGDRVKEARELRGLTQAQLAESVGLDHSAIAHIEAGRIQPKPEVLDALADTLGFPVPFFEDPDAADFPVGSLLFRARRDILRREEAQARAWGAVLYRPIRRMVGELEAPPVTLPRLSGANPVLAAAHARAALGLSPDAPIQNLVYAVERSGVLVLALPVALARRDAYSVWVGDEELRPLIVLMGDAPGDRLRFGVAHELGHLVMHQGRPARVTEIERQAGEFAAELLMPESGIRADLVPPVTLSSLSRLKPKWGVAIQSLIRRAHDLDVISDRQYRYLFEQVARRGWRTHEPDNLAIPVERPRAVRKIVEVLFGDPPDYRKLGEAMRLHPHQARQIVQAHAERSQLPARGTVGDPRVVPFPKPRVLAT